MTDEPSPAEREELRNALEQARRELQERLESSRETGEPVAVDTAIGRLTRVDALQQQSMARAQLRSAETRLSQIAAALDRLARGDYGECLSCGEPIRLARLRVRPEATLCLGCQESRERGQ